MREKQGPHDSRISQLRAKIVAKRVASQIKGQRDTRCRDLYSYLANNMDNLTNYGQRHRRGHPISSSRAEGCVDDIGNTRMGKRRRMRWSPKGAHRVAVVRAAVLDGRLTGAYQRTAADPQRPPPFAHSPSCLRFKGNATAPWRRKRRSPGAATPAPAFRELRQPAATGYRYRDIQDTDCING